MFFWKFRWGSIDRAEVVLHKKILADMKQGSVVLDISEDGKSGSFKLSNNGNIIYQDKHVSDSYFMNHLVMWSMSPSFDNCVITMVSNVLLNSRINWNTNASFGIDHDQYSLLLFIDELDKAVEELHQSNRSLVLLDTHGHYNYISGLQWYVFAFREKQRS